LPFVGRYVRAHKEARCSGNYSWGRYWRLISGDKRVSQAHVKIKFNGLKHIPAHRPCRQPVDLRDFSFQGGIRISAPCNLKCPILLQLLDHRISHQHFDMGEEGFVFESRNGNSVNIAQVIWLYWPNVIAKAAAQDKAGKYCRKDRFHGAGEADASGEADVSGSGDASELVFVLGGADGGSGAVVVSGESEAGGGSETSVSGEGNGAWSFAEPGAAGPRSAVRFPDGLLPFFLGACAVTGAG
jgi:hypothetical protein